MGQAEGLAFWLCAVLTTLALCRQEDDAIAAAVDEASCCITFGALRVKQELFASQQLGLSA